MSSKLVHNLNLFNKLRSEHPVFIYKGYQAKTNQGFLSVEYKYQIPELVEFSSPLKIEISNEIDDTERLLTEINPILFCIGLADLISYWKVTCSPTIKIETDSINSRQVSFWKELFFQGLSEFRYVNGIEATKDEFVDFELGQGHTSLPAKKLEGNLIPIGGGKDSLTTLSLLSQDSTLSNACFILNPRKACVESVKLFGYEDRAISAYRTIDSKLIELNTQGYLNGHTPFSALLGFISCLAAYLNDKRYIVLSNESSAEEENSAGVNHQYSKSCSYENLFKEYLSTFLSSELEYFSLLRPLNELQIVKHFVKNREAISIFQSCNVGSKTDSWCTNCPKCLFVYIMLGPFIEKTELLKLFKRDLLDDSSLTEIFDGLCGLTEVKPLECVGTRAEIQSALKHTIENTSTLPVLLRRFKDSPLFAQAPDISLILKEKGSSELVPEHFKAILAKEGLL
ncbi:MAG: hypothetical protein H6619_05270 [Deltaproteobacteria bacterium]|nr:hypothetical protein [Deltaproteobacteria bacterium]